MSAIAESHPDTPAAILHRSTLTGEQRVLGLSKLWSEARFSFAYFERMAPRWDDLFEALIPRIQAAASDYEYYLELMRFYSHLKDGHSGVFWPAAIDRALGYPPMEIRKIEDRAVIFRILRETEDIVANGIRPGMAIVQVDGKPVSERIAFWRELKAASTEQATDRLAYFRVLTGPRDSQVAIQLQEPGKALRTARLVRSEAYFNDTNLEPERLFASRMLDGGVGYFQANQMNTAVADAFAAFLDSADGLTRLILDVRYNGGGSDSVSAALVSRVIDAPLDGQIYEVTSYRADRRAFRQSPEIIGTMQDKIAPANGKRFTGPLVILIGEQTHSAAEGGFLSVVRRRPRTQLVGEPTAGSTGQPLGFALPGGGLGVVCSRRSSGPDGRTFVGHDSVLLKALDVVRQMSTGDRE